jgi:hypothetical protein
MESQRMGSVWRRVAEKAELNGRFVQRQQGRCFFQVSEDAQEGTSLGTKVPVPCLSFF